jgi:hypothetical protein
LALRMVSAAQVCWGHTQHAEQLQTGCCMHSLSHAGRRPHLV